VDSVDQSSLPKLGAIILLAAGEGTRMKSKKPKVLHEIAGRTLLHHVLAATSGLATNEKIVVVGSGKEEVENHLAQITGPNENLKIALQSRRLGTGDAVSSALAVTDVEGAVLILAGDTPLLSAETLADFYRDFVERGLDLSLLTVEASDPFGYGRVLRDSNDNLIGVREEKDASERERQIKEINTGVYCVNSTYLTNALEQLSPNNAQGEYYLTDIISLIRSIGGEVGAYCAFDEDEFLGVNDRSALALVTEVFHERRNQDLMANGVTLIDPTTTWIDQEAIIESDVEIWPGTFIHGQSTIRSGAVIGPRSVIKDSLVESGAYIRESEISGAKIGAGATVGPYSYIRPGVTLEAGAKIGAYVEVKNSRIGAGAKVPHLSYVGDAEIGEGTNIGAATIFVNYDGEEKHQTKVGKHARIGSDTMLVAPVEVGDGAYTAAGSVITENVPAGAIAVARAHQKNILGWVFRKRAGSKSAQAAKEAGAAETS
jgi:bifunctional UDP-N-acetylglucosamine pyrophosphorylase / glucosamine-1-phosphate N-acetyltransferase